MTMIVSRLVPSRSLSASALVLALLLALAGGVQTAAAQQPILDGDKPIATLEDAVRTAESDSQLVVLAETLLKAREETRISHATYQKGVLLFRNQHPDFYGNFFGDPFYATYDARYQKLTRERQMIETNINPLNSFENSTSFFCHPLSYDPAFNGTCRGFNFASSDFFFLPHPFLRIPSASIHTPLFANASSSFYVPARDEKQARKAHRRTDETDSGDGNTETDSCEEASPSACDDSGPTVAAKLHAAVQRVEPAAPEIETADLAPDEVETLSVREWANLGARLRKHLSLKERSKLISRLGGTTSLTAASSEAAFQLPEEDRRGSAMRRQLEEMDAAQFDRNAPDREDPPNRTSSHRPVNVDVPTPDVPDPDRTVNRPPETAPSSTPSRSASPDQSEDESQQNESQQ